MDHVSHDGTGSNNRDLDHDIVEVCGPQSRQARHLCTAFNLKHSDRVGALQCIVNSLVVLWQMREIDLLTIRLANQID